MRAEREFLRVIISHRRCSILAGTSTKKFKVCQALPDQDLEAYRPVCVHHEIHVRLHPPRFLRPDREDARRIVTAIAEFLGRSFQFDDLSRKIQT